MPAYILPKLTRTALIGAVLATIQACAATPVATEVAQAYEASGVIGLGHPYTRTIFSSSNF
ncbi:MAG: hypothetical protein KGJ21_09655 [Pseudomonadota bacterium]|nr:hypothetical protein [Pseudomonadota bacterium]